MSNTDATKGQAALASSDYPTAVSHLTKALNSQSTPSPLWLIQRSTAYQRTGQHALALADADNAVLAAYARGKRELIATAHFRRAVALHGMGRYGDARLCLLWCQKFNEKEKGVTMWQAKVKADYEKAGGEEAECNKVSVKEVPDKVEEVQQKIGEEGKENVRSSKGEKAKVGVAKAEPEKAAAPAATSQTPKEKIRNEWYQSNTTVTIEIFAKGVPHDAEVDIQEGSVSLLSTFDPDDVLRRHLKALLTRHSSRLVSLLQHSLPPTTTPSALSSPRSTNRNQASESPHIRSRLSSPSQCQG
jgi:suppressor of G2 allele of SKP1